MGKAGLEPARRKAQDPKSCVSTNFTTCPQKPDSKYKNIILHKGLIVSDAKALYTPANPFEKRIAEKTARPGMVPEHKQEIILD